MENRDFKISIKIVWVLAIGNFLLTSLCAFAKIRHWEFFHFVLTLGLILFFSTWIITISDMIKNKIYNKTFWVMSMFILPTIAPIFYLIQRDKLIRLGNKLGN